MQMVSHGVFLNLKDAHVAKAEMLYLLEVGYMVNGHIIT